MFLIPLIMLFNNNPKPPTTNTNTLRNEITQNISKIVQKNCTSSTSNTQLNNIEGVNIFGCTNSKISSSNNITSGIDSNCVFNTDIQQEIANDISQTLNNVINESNSSSIFDIKDKQDQNNINNLTNVITTNDFITDINNCIQSAVQNQENTIKNSGIYCAPAQLDSNGNTIPTTGDIISTNDISYSLISQCIGSSKLNDALTNISDSNATVDITRKTTGTLDGVATVFRSIGESVGAAISGATFGILAIPIAILIVIIILSMIPKASSSASQFGKRRLVYNFGSTDTDNRISFLTTDEQKISFGFIILCFIYMYITISASISYYALPDKMVPVNGAYATTVDNKVVIDTKTIEKPVSKYLDKNATICYFSLSIFFIFMFIITVIIKFSLNLNIYDSNDNTKLSIIYVFLFIEFISYIYCNIMYFKEVNPGIKDFEQ